MRWSPYWARRTVASFASTTMFRNKVTSSRAIFCMCPAIRSFLLVVTTSPNSNCTSGWIPLRRQVLAQRSRRVPPSKDDKILAAWNGMMISALARGSRILGDKRYLEAAERAADFILTEMVHDGLLLRTYRSCRQWFCCERIARLS